MSAYALRCRVCEEVTVAEPLDACRRCDGPTDVPLARLKPTAAEPGPVTRLLYAPDGKALAAAHSGRRHLVPSPGLNTSVCAASATTCAEVSTSPGAITYPEPRSPELSTATTR